MLTYARSHPGFLIKLVVFVIILGIVAFLAGVAIYQSRISNNPLLNAAEAGDLDRVRLLIKQGTPINARSPHIKFGWTPLIAAIYADQTNVAHYLVEAGADINLTDNGGETPLMWATSRGDDGVDMVRYLIVHGADLYAKDNYGATAFSYVRSDPPKPKLVEVLEAAKREQESKSGKKE
jgi:ankyrin repeat protein